MSSNAGKQNEKIALVTGASRLNGIGASVCKQLAARGTNIFFTFWTSYDKSMPWGIDAEEPYILQKEIQELGVRCESIEIDLSNPKSSLDLFNEVEERLGEASILVNNACYSTRDGYMAVDAVSLDAHYAINVRATALLSVEFVRRFTKGSGGRIINVTSGQSRGPMVGEIAYATTKGAVDALTVTLSAEVAHKGITVNAVNPGPTDTGWISDDLKEKILRRFPMGRIGEPQDAARLITFLASEDAEWITGQVIHSEGGFTR